MAYTYRNKKTGEEIVTSNKITGKNWEFIEEEPLYSPEGMEDPFDDVFEEDPVDEEPTEKTGEGVPVEETPAEEAPAPKPKASRKGKK